ncbi:NADH:ubiquinone oxidoreductase subunit NDUFA12 [Rhodobacter maris]|uniref:NADH:ubiquinone oxidoreductase subunit n=1 Tax=Rhodobacter maris TaxID=446682 RepID=A0A285RJA9_9RHOB|nr:NADH:ubiquinone oxidoreductase subunit NDUFA12 [Rhodobacter maris]SOB93769.1 NADH:ubiquinone oxidoreductase subunit [Rhodobacter maris]
MKFLLRLLTWWNDQTLGTQIYTARFGVKVGEDAEGNRYFQSKDGKRRWVIYNGECQASRIPPDWHGWIHHTWDAPPTAQPLAHKPWELPHQENQTGLATAYIPPGSQRRLAPVERHDYEAWQPE